MRRPWLRLSIGLIAGIIALGAIACGGGGDDKKDSATSTPAASETTAAPTGAATTSPTGQTPTAQATQGGPASNATVQVVTNAALGQILADSQGRTLYTYRQDVPGVSACTGTCVSTWPPLVAQGTPTAGAGVTGAVGVLARPDGVTQVTVDGMPVYTYSGDLAPGQANGQAVSGLWYVIEVP